MDTNKEKKENEIKENINSSSIHELQNARRKMRQRNIYEKLNKIKEENNDTVKKDVIQIPENDKEKITREEKLEQKNKVKEQEEKKETKKSNNKKIEKKLKKEKNKKQKLKTKKQWKKSRITKSIIILILITIITSMSLFMYKVCLNGGGLKGIIAATVGQTPTKLENLGPINILVLGTNEGNTDTIIVASYNPKTQEASMLSIPRDTFVGNNVNTAPASEKINAMLNIQGIDSMLKKVENITGLKIPYYLIVTTDNIGKLVDLVGEIDFDVPIDMNYHDTSQDLVIELKKGLQKIDGKKSEMLLRFRHNDDGTTYPSEYGSEDLGRMRTQKDFIKALINQSIKKFDISKIYSIIGNADQFVKTNLKFKDYKDYVPYIIEMNAENIKTAQVEGHGILTNYYFFIPDYNRLDEIIFDLFVFSDDERKNDPSSFKVKRNINQIVSKNESSTVEHKENVETPKKPPIQNKPQTPEEKTPENNKPTEKPEEKNPTVNPETKPNPNPETPPVQEKDPDKNNKTN